MPFGETKIYYDGSHYIAIPHTTRDVVRRPKPPDEVINVTKEINEQEQGGAAAESADAPAPLSAASSADENINDTGKIKPSETTNTYRSTKKELFNKLYNKLYNESFSMPRDKRKKVIIKAMQPYFKTEELTIEYVDRNFERKTRNMISRRTRCIRKANLADFNYFVTFTYDDKLHTEDSFRKKLMKCLYNFCFRKGWKYIGVWERSPQKKRLHFHGLLYIPEGTMPGELSEKNDYSFRSHKRQITKQNSYFNENFGRSDFAAIDDPNGFRDAVMYILKYIEKLGERIFYSKGLPQYFHSDILDDDVVCRIGQEDKKLLLFDDFMCIDEGTLIGKVSKDVIKKMRTSS